MDQSYGGFEYFVQFLIDTGLLDALGDAASDAATQYTENIILYLWNLLVEMGKELLRESALLLVAAIILLVGIVFALIVCVVVFILAVISYVFRSIGLMRIAKKLGVKHRFLAWIPFGSDYLTGICTEKCIEREGKKPWKWGAILILLFTATTVGMPILQLIVSIVLSVLPMFSALLNLLLSSASLIYTGFYVYCLFRIFKQFSGTTGGIIFAGCTWFMGLIEGIFVFIVSCMKLRAPEGAADQKDAEVPAAGLIPEAEEDPFA